MKPVPVKIQEERHNGPASPMTKLLKEQEQLTQPRMVPTVEIYPVQLNYEVVDGKTPNPSKGFVLVSQRTRIHDALQGLMKVTASKTSSSCRRVWSNRDNGTSSGDGYEVVDFQSLDGKLIRNAEDEEQEPQMLTGEWVRTYGNMDTIKEIDVLVEIKRPNSKWPRAALELENRIQVGDFVDAQDVTGNWFEALVQQVADDTVTVHYFGWASKWNATIRRRESSEITGASPVSATTSFFPLSYNSSNLT
jgi:hypothetical protein